MKMQDLGRKYSEPSVVSDKPSNEKYYPSIYLDKEQMSAAGLSRSQAGDELQMIAKVRVRSKSDSISGGGSVDLEIVEAAFEAAPEGKDTASILYGDD